MELGGARMHARARGTAGGSGRACRGSPRRRSPRHVRGIVRLAATSLVRSQLLPQACVPARGRPRRGLTAAASPPVLLAAGLVPFFFSPGRPCARESFAGFAGVGRDEPSAQYDPAGRARSASACMHAWAHGCMARRVLRQGALIGCFFDLLRLLVD